MPAHLTRPESEFGHLAGAPPVVRRWVNVSDGGHVSGVAWGTEAAGVTVLPGPDRDARAADAIALHAGRPLLVLDLPGTGRSSGPAAGTARRAARPLSEAVLSFAPATRILVGIHAAAPVAAHLATRLPRVDHLVLVDGLPEEGPLPERVTLLRSPGGPLPEEGVRALAERRPDLVVVDLTTPAAHLYDQAPAAIAGYLR